LLIKLYFFKNISYLDKEVTQMNRIKELRKLKKVSQKEVASNLGIAQNTLSTWEVGRYEPDSDSLVKLADYFNVSIDYLLGRSDEKRPAVPEDDGSHKNEVLVRSRNGMVVQKSYTDEQIKFIISLIDAIPDNDDDDDI